MFLRAEATMGVAEKYNNVYGLTLEPVSAAPGG
jgi:hypothetical protein